MKAVVLYYTFGGSTKKEAERQASELNAPLCRVEEARRRSFLAAFVPGGFQAMRRKTVAIQSPDVDLNDYDRIIIGCPIWAGYPAPAFNTIVEYLPKGKKVELFFCSGGTGSEKSEQGTKTMIEKKGCTLLSYRDIRTGVPPSRMKE